MWAFVATIIVVPVIVYGMVRWYEQRYQALPVLGPPQHTVQFISATSQLGDSVSKEAWENKIVVASFFFTHCPSICPKMVYNLKRIQAYNSKDILIASFTVDPERDTAARLQQYATQTGISNNWLFLTGDKKELYRFARKELMLVATDGDGGPADFIHSENLVLIDKQKRIRGYYKGTDEAQVNALAKDIKKLEAEKE